ncbi:MAG: hypothetical protein U0165_00400 [Polyangiaceae bacterium]
MRRASLVVLALFLPLLKACNGEIAPRDLDGSAGTGAAGSAGFSGHAGHHLDAGHDAETDASNDIADAFDEYIDPGCPDAGPAITDYACDPFNPIATCGNGLTCIPYVDDPVEECGQEIYGTKCTLEGSGVQGDDCSFGCKAGFSCVATGQGVQCVRVCQISSGQCPGGLVCEQLDVPGYGGCL